MSAQHVLLATANRLQLRRATCRDPHIRRATPRRVRRGVYCLDPSRAPTFIESVVAALLVLPAGSVAAGVTAGRLWRLDGLRPAATEERLEFLVPGRTNGAKLVGTALRFETCPHIALPQGVPSTSQARTIVELLVRLPFIDGVAVAESAMRRDPGLPAALRAERQLRPKARGNGRVDRALGFAGRLSESVLESHARVLWHEAGLTEPVQQAVIRDGGRFVARVDFLWEAAALIVEVDGFAKYGEPGALRAEKRRQNELVGLGYVVLRFTWADIVGRPDYVVAQVRRFLISRK